MVGFVSEVPVKRVLDMIIGVLELEQGLDSVALLVNGLGILHGGGKRSAISLLII
jgi:hypothetical protein